MYKHDSYIFIHQSKNDELGCNILYLICVIKDCDLTNKCLQQDTESKPNLI